MALFDSFKAYGPVPSRRLGMSLGINNIPAKVCTYDCIYCQVGRTTMMTKNRDEFYDPLFSEKLPHVEYLIGYEGNAFTYTGDAKTDILSITAVHPMRKSAINRLLSKAGAKWKLVDRLVAQGNLTVSEYEGHSYYLRSGSYEESDH